MYTTSITAGSQPEIRDLGSEELDTVSGAHPILVGIIFAELFGIGLLGGMIAHDIMYPDIQFPD